MTQVLETTREKADRLLSPEVRKVLQDNGLIIVDRDDFKLVMDGYNEARTLRARLRKAERRIANDERPDSSGSG